MGQEFGSWTVIEFAGRDQRYNKFWFCRCRCGVESRVRETVLLGRASHGCKSCGNRRGWLRRPRRGRTSGSNLAPGEKFSYLPTPDEIREACRQIRRERGHVIASDLR